MWAVHILFTFLLGTVCVLLYSTDENHVKHEFIAEVVNTIQEDHEDSTDYYVVYKLQNGNLIDVDVDRKVYGNSNTGDLVKLQLSNYEAGVAARGSTVLWTTVVMILTAMYVWYGTFRLLSDYRKYKKQKYTGYY